MRKAWSVISSVLVALVVLLAVALVGVRLVGLQVYTVLSGSMEPVIQTGDMIFLHSTDPARLQTGDVICYLDSGQAITHRIVGIREGEDGQVRYVTQGDGNNTADRQAVSADQVQGNSRDG